MYNEKQILEKCKEFAKKYFDMEFDEDIRISKRMTKALGRCDASLIRRGNIIVNITVKELIFAHYFFQDPQYSDEELDSVIKHELVHWFFFKHNQDRGHDKEFKRVCASIGGDLGYTNSEIVIQKKELQYVIVCSQCGTVSALRKRQPSEKLMLGKVSGCCHAKLVNLGQQEMDTSKYDEQFEEIKSAYNKRTPKH